MIHVRSLNRREYGNTSSHELVAKATTKGQIRKDASINEHCAFAPEWNSKPRVFSLIPALCVESAGMLSNALPCEYSFNTRPMSLEGFRRTSQ